MWILEFQHGTGEFLRRETVESSKNINFLISLFRLLIQKPLTQYVLVVTQTQYRRMQVSSTTVFMVAGQPSLPGNP